MFLNTIGNLQRDLHNQGVIDSGCSRHMTGNMSYLTDYEEIDGGYVAFSGNPKGGKITGKRSLRKFDGKADEGFFVDFSVIVKFRVFIVETRDSRRKHTILDTQSNGFTSTKVSDNAGQARKEIEPVKDYILLPLWTADPPYSQDPKSSHDDRSKPSNDDGKNVDEDPRKASLYFLH
ncbi:hypothetical protein Tco_0419377 [Tanacetum coccineum]